MDDIASEASVHRTTVYKYFANRDELLAGVMFWENEGVLVEAERLLDRGATFAEGLADAFEHVMRAIAGSSLLRRIFDPVDGEDVVRVAGGSHEFQARVMLVLRPRIEHAASGGELRSDLSVDDVVEWLATVTLMLLGESFRDPDRDVVDALRRFVLPGVLASPGT
jgi:AcrR family transcriptional regulator